MDLRIGIAGPSGTGKSTLAKWISEEYNIPFITTSTKPLWDKHGITSHLELIKKTTLDPDWGLNFQYEVIKFRQEAIQGYSDFVTDRSPVDNLAYFLMQNTHLLAERDTDQYIKACSNALSNFTGIIGLPFTDLIQLEDDGKRVNNKYYQTFTNEAFNVSIRLLSEKLKGISGMSLLVWDMEKRIYDTNIFLANLKGKQ